jgi:hypothetical protein
MKLTLAEFILLVCKIAARNPQIMHPDDILIHFVSLNDKTLTDEAFVKWLYLQLRPSLMDEAMMIATASAEAAEAAAISAGASASVAASVAAAAAASAGPSLLDSVLGPNTNRSMHWAWYTPFQLTHTSNRTVAGYTGLCCNTTTTTNTTTTAYRDFDHFLRLDHGLDDGIDNDAFKSLCKTLTKGLDIDFIKNKLISFCKANQNTERRKVSRQVLYHVDKIQVHHH